MFWGLGGGAKPSNASATGHADASRRSSQNAEIAAAPTVLSTPSYVLSEQRRSELLLAARTNRVSWIDGAEERRNQALSAGSSEFPGSLAVSAIPSHCRDALEGVNEELSRFFASLDELKLKILANDMQLTEEAAETAADARTLPDATARCSRSCASRRRCWISGSARTARGRGS